jgi:hypothetical protein
VHIWSWTVGIIILKPQFNVKVPSKSKAATSYLKFTLFKDKKSDIKNVIELDTKFLNSKLQTPKIILVGMLTPRTPIHSIS